MDDSAETLREDFIVIMLLIKRRLSKLVTTLKTRGLSQTLRYYGEVGTLPVRVAVSQTVIAIKALGLQKGTRYLQEKKRTLRACRNKTKTGGARADFLLDAPGLKFPVTGRSGSSDVFVYEQMFVQHEYSCLPDMASVKTIVDCGANVGYASAYMLSRFPDAKVVAIEPDSGNFEMLKKNMSPYGERARLLQAGVWSHKADLVVQREARGGEEWAFTVEECPPGRTPDVKAVGIGELMTQFQMDTIDILKVDIEGSEKNVFGANYENWIDRVRLLVMELHGPECEQAVQSAVAHRKHTVTRFEELTVFHFADTQGVR